MKDSFYFPHDYNARSDERILQIRAEHGLAGYALYFMLLESMAESADGYLNLEGMAGLSLSYGSAIEQLKALISRCIELGLFHEVKGRFSSKRMIEYKNFRKERAESGRRGAANRWENGSAIQQPLAKSKTANAKERKGKERKEEKIQGFAPPNPLEVGEYCKERSNGISGQYFCDFYQARGWKLSSGASLKDWRAAIRTWEQRQKPAKKKDEFQPFSSDYLQDVGLTPTL